MGIHMETINVLRDGMKLKKAMKEASKDEEQSLDVFMRSGQVTGRLGLLADELERYLNGATQ